VIDIVEGDKRDEALLHRRLRAMGKGVAREWFILDEEVGAVLSSYRNGSLYESIQREKALQSVLTMVDDVGKAIRRLAEFLKKR
jgi:hypothetical protein